VTLGTGTLSIGDGTNSSYGGNISGAGSLVTTGSGTVTLSGSNTYSGGTVVAAGNLVLGSTASIPATGKILIQSGGALDVSGAYSSVTAWLNSNAIHTASGGALALTGNSNENINLAVAGGGAYTNISLGSVGANTYSGALTPAGNTYYLGGGGGTLTMVNNGALVNSTSATRGLAINGNVTLSGSNSYGGGTAINAGTLNVAGDASLGAVPTSPATNLTFAGNATLQAGAPNIALAASRNLVINPSVTATLDTNGGSLAIAGAISGSGGLAIVGGGVLTLSGSSTFSGGAQIDSGTLNLAHPLAVQNSTVNLGPSGGLNFAAGNTSPTLGGLSGVASVVLATASLSPVSLNVGNNGQSTTYSGNLSGGGGLVKSGSGTLTLTAPSTYNGPTAIAGGVLQLSGSVTGTVAYNFDNGTLQGWSTVMSGAYSFVPMSTANNNGGVSGAQSGLYWVSDSNGTIGGRDYEGNTQFIRSPQFILGSGNLTFYLAGGSHAALPANASSVIASPNTSSSGYMGVALENVSTGAFVLALAGAGDSSSWQAESFTQAQLAPYVGGTYTLDVINQYSGGWGWITLDTVSIPAVQAGSNLLPVATPLSIASNATLDLSGGSQQVASLSDKTPGNGGSIINSNSAASVLTLSPSGGSTTFSGMIQGGGGAPSGSGTISLIVNGSGTQVLAGSNTYTGGTTVSTGQLIVNGSLGSTVVSVSGGASLGGTGSLGGRVTVAGGSTAATQGTIKLVDGIIGTMDYSDAGPSDTALTLGGAVAGNPSILDFELGPSADRILIDHGKMLVNPGGGLINITALSGIQPGVYDLIDFPAGQASGLQYLNLGTTSLPGGYQLGLQYTSTAEQLVVTTPEPSTFALLGVGAVGLLAYGLRRRRPFQHT
jgi:autotransporter-associated beta strand protein